VWIDSRSCGCFGAATRLSTTRTLSSSPSPLLRGRVTFPAFFTAAAKDLISRLLQADLSKRYGCMETAALRLVQLRHLCL
jgi:hypothetical protein